MTTLTAPLPAVRALALLVAVTATGATSAAADGPERRPLPDDGVIAAPGAYVLEADRTVDRAVGIDVRADGVTIDLAGHALRYAGTPKPGVLGISVSGRRDVRIHNGSIGGFWFNVHCTGVERLRVHDVAFDDIPYLAVNLARSKDVAVCDNVFSNFRYDIEKPAKSTYLIGVNVAADDVLVSANRFSAAPPAGTGAGLQLETVFVLFRPSRGAVVSHNDMAAAEVLNRGYGVWVASNAEVAVLHNRVRNVQFGVCVAADGSAAVLGNQFGAEGGSGSVETTGIAASGARSLLQANNIEGFRRDTAIGPQPATQPD